MPRWPPLKSRSEPVDRVAVGKSPGVPLYTAATLMATTAAPFVSIVIPNWNGARFLRACLGSLRAQTYPAREVVVVDGASTDGSAELVRSDYPEVCLLVLSENRGFAGNVNAGIRRSRGELVALLNNDAVADPDWLEELVGGFSDPRVGSCASKMLLVEPPDVLNSAGDFYSRDGLPGNRGVWEQDRGQYDEDQRVFGACAGAAAYRRSLLDDIGLFDERFFYQCEDVDLAYRAQLAGYVCRYVPSARVHHRLSATGGGTLASYYCGRNFIWVALKNTPPSLLKRYWPRMLRAQARLALDALRHAREPAARARLRGQWKALREMGGIIRARREVQRRTRVSARYIESILV
jgi:GT2 family glycosyltransferase